MKKYLLLFVAAIACLTLSMSLSACGGNDDDSLDDKYEDTFTIKFDITPGNVPSYLVEHIQNSCSNTTFGPTTVLNAKNQFDISVKAIDKDMTEAIKEIKDQNYTGFSVTMTMKSDTKGKTVKVKTWSE